MQEISQKELSDKTCQPENLRLLFPPSCRIAFGDPSTPDTGKVVGFSPPLAGADFYYTHWMVLVELDQEGLDYPVVPVPLFQASEQGFITHFNVIRLYRKSPF